MISLTEKNKQKLIVTDKLLRDKAFDIAQNLKYDGYQRRLASIFYNFFNKNTSGSGIKNIPNKELAEELHKLIIRKFNKRKYTHLLQTIFGLQIQQICNR